MDRQIKQPLSLLKVGFVAQFINQNDANPFFFIDAQLDQYNQIIFPPKIFSNPSQFCSTGIHQVVPKEIIFFGIHLGPKISSEIWNYFKHKPWKMPKLNECA